MRKKEWEWAAVVSQQWKLRLYLFCCRYPEIADEIMEQGQAELRRLSDNQIDWQDLFKGKIKLKK